MTVPREGPEPALAPQWKSVAVAQGIYYVVTGIWPLLSMGTFQLITGRKRDLWLVQTAGALIGLNGCVLFAASRTRRIPPEMAVLGAGTAASLATIDILYYKRGILRWVYLGDALAELGCIAAWIAPLLRRRS